MSRVAWTYLGALLATGLVALGYSAGLRAGRCPPPQSCGLAEQAAVLEYRVQRTEMKLQAALENRP